MQRHAIVARSVDTRLDLGRFLAEIASSRRGREARGRVHDPWTGTRRAVGGRGQFDRGAVNLTDRLMTARLI